MVKGLDREIVMTHIRGPYNWKFDIEMCMVTELQV